MADELVERARFSEAAANPSPREDALAREENEDGRHDRQVREQRVDIAEGALALPLGDQVGHGGEHGVHHVERRGVEVRRETVETAFLRVLGEEPQVDPRGDR